MTYAVFLYIFQRFYRYHELMHEKEAEKAIKMGASANSRPPYWQIFKQAFPQLFNIFFVFFITLALFPAVQSGMQQHFLFDFQF